MEIPEILKKKELPYDLEILLLCSILKSVCQRDICTPIVIVAPFIIVKKWEQSVTIIIRTDMENEVCIHNRMYLVIKNKMLPFVI